MSRQLRTGLALTIAMSGAAAAWPAYADHFALIGAEENGAEMLNLDTIQRPDSTGRGTVWLVYAYRTTQTVGRDTFDLAMAKWQFDCAKESVRILSLHLYDINGNAQSKDEKPRPAQTIVPGSLYAVPFDAVCKGKALNPTDTLEAENGVAATRRLREIAATGKAP